MEAARSLGIAVARVSDYGTEAVAFHARGRDVRHGGGHRDREAEHGTGGVRRSPAEADEDARGAGAHQVQRRLVRRATADDHGHVELVDELLEVQRLGLAGDVLGRHRGPADDEHVDARVDDVIGQVGLTNHQRKAHPGLPAAQFS